MLSQRKQNVHENQINTSCDNLTASPSEFSPQGLLSMICKQNILRLQLKNQEIGKSRKKSKICIQQFLAQLTKYQCEDRMTSTAL